jgi:hypothetical protein
VVGGEGEVVGFFEQARQAFDAVAFGGADARELEFGLVGVKF